METSNCCPFHFYSGKEGSLHNSILKLCGKKTKRVRKKIRGMEYPQILDLKLGRKGILNKIEDKYVLTTESNEIFPIFPVEEKSLIVYEDRNLAVVKFSMYWTLKKIEENIGNTKYLDRLTHGICPLLMKDLNAVIGLLMISKSKF